eukprot:s586_g20.t1
MPPFSIGFVKGWRRSLSALIICEGVKALGIDIAELTDEFKAGLVSETFPDICIGWMHTDAVSMHAACGGFIAIVQHLKESVPQKDFNDAAPDLLNQFKLGILDADILSFLESTVPPISLDRAQQTERDLADKVMLATVEQMKHTFTKDMETLRARIPSQAQIAKEAALDKKYLADRQEP